MVLHASNSCYDKGNGTLFPLKKASTFFIFFGRWIVEKVIQDPPRPTLNRTYNSFDTLQKKKRHYPVIDIEKEITESIFSRCNLTTTAILGYQLREFSPSSTGGRIIIRSYRRCSKTVRPHLHIYKNTILRTAYVLVDPDSH